MIVNINEKCEKNYSNINFFLKCIIFFPPVFKNSGINYITKYENGLLYNGNGYSIIGSNRFH